MESWEGKAWREVLNLGCVAILETCERVSERIEAAERLRAIAQEKGATSEAVALKRLDVSLLSEEELEALEEEIDLAAMRRAREEDDPAGCKTLDDLCAVCNVGET